MVFYPQTSWQKWWMLKGVFQQKISTPQLVKLLVSGVLKWWVSPNKPMGFSLLKMIIKRGGCEMGVPSFKETPLWISRQVKSVLCSFLIVFGLVTAVVGTYLAVVDMGWCSRCALGLEVQGISKNSWRSLIPLELWSTFMNLYHSFLVNSVNKMWCWKVPIVFLASQF